MKSFTLYIKKFNLYMQDQKNKKSLYMLKMKYLCDKQPHNKVGE